MKYVIVVLFVAAVLLFSFAVPIVPASIECNVEPTNPNCYCAKGEVKIQEGKYYICEPPDIFIDPHENGWQDEAAGYAES